MIESYSVNTDKEVLSTTEEKARSFKVETVVDFKETEEEAKKITDVVVQDSVVNEVSVKIAPAKLVTNEGLVETVGKLNGNGGSKAIIQGVVEPD